MLLDFRATSSRLPGVPTDRSSSVGWSGAKVGDHEARPVRIFILHRPETPLKPYIVPPAFQTPPPASQSNLHRAPIPAPSTAPPPAPWPSPIPHSETAPASSAPAHP